MFLYQFVHGLEEIVGGIQFGELSYTAGISRWRNLLAGCPPSFFHDH